jgi:hypothetical protein
LTGTRSLTRGLGEIWAVDPLMDAWRGCAPGGGRGPQVHGGPWPRGFHPILSGPLVANRAAWDACTREWRRDSGASLEHRRSSVDLELHGSVSSAVWTGGSEGWRRAHQGLTDGGGATEFTRLGHRRLGSRARVEDGVPASGSCS